MPVSQSAKSTALYHVVRGASGARLDGFSIRGGNANYQPSGNTDPNVANCIGGGILTGSNAEATALASGGTAASGGMTIENTIIENNSCEAQGGGAFLMRAADVLRGSTVRYNRMYRVTGSGGGGGVYCLGTASIDACQFIRNTTAAAPGNTSTWVGKGGGLYVGGGTGVTIIQTVFSANDADTIGGGLFVEGSGTVVTNCVFTGNRSEIGGAIGSYPRSSMSGSSPLTMDLRFCTLYSNQGGAFNGSGGSDSAGGAIFADDTDLTLRDCIVSGNTATNGAQVLMQQEDRTTTLRVSYTVLTGGTAGVGLWQYLTAPTPTIVNGGGVVDATPTFVNAGNPAGADSIFRTSDDGLALQTGSAGINVGVSISGITLDALGASRSNGGTPDCGAYEYNRAPTITAISNVATNQEVATASIPIAVADLDGTTNLAVTATSSNTTLIPNAGLAVSGSGTAWSLIATPAVDQYGTSTITVTVSDGTLMGSTSFVITVNAVNQAPVNTFLPSITGTNSLGSTVLTASTGTWTDHETAPASLTFAYQWWRADDTAGTNAATIGGATSNTYTVAAGDASKAIRVRVSATDGGYGTAAAATTPANSAWIGSGVTSLPPTISSTLTAAGVVGTAFTYQITGSNTPTSFNATGLPVGLSVNTSTGAVSGSPTTVGTSNVTISATNASGSGTATLVITVTAPPAITSTLTAAGIVGSAFSYQITGSYTPTSFNASGLPAGLTVNTATGSITGTPTAVGTTNATITATNGTGTGSATLVITIAASGSGGSTVSGGGGGGCGAGGAVGLLLAGLTLLGLRRRR